MPTPPASAPPLSSRVGTQVHSTMPKKRAASSSSGPAPSKKKRNGGAANASKPASKPAAITGQTAAEFASLTSTAQPDDLNELHQTPELLDVAHFIWLNRSALGFARGFDFSLHALENALLAPATSDLLDAVRSAPRAPTRRPRPARRP